MRSRSTHIAAALAASLFAATPALAAEIAGRVTDAYGRGIVASVTIHSEHGSEQTRTDENGHFHFGGLPGGAYSVEAESVGFRPAHERDIHVEEEHEATVNMILTQGGIDGAIEVDAP